MRPRGQPVLEIELIDSIHPRTVSYRIAMLGEGNFFSPKKGKSEGKCK